MRYSILLLCLAALSTAAAQTETKVESVIEAGQDGRIRFYDVRCATEASGRITLNRTTREVCAIKFGERPICEQEIDLMEAAVKICG